MFNPLNSSNTDPLSTRLKNRRVGRKVRKIGNEKPKAKKKIKKSKPEKQEGGMPVIIAFIIWYSLFVFLFQFPFR